MQRYFLIFSMIFLSYLLLINYNPPKEEINETSDLNDSEYSQLLDNEEFVSKEDIYSEEIFIDEAACDVNDFIYLSSKNWKIKVNLDNGKISYAELVKFPTTAGSNKNKLLFNNCGSERYSHVSGFAFLNKNLDKKTLFKLSENYQDGLNNVYVFEKKIK